MKIRQSQAAAAYEMSINIYAYILASCCHKYVQLKNNWEPI